MKIVLQRVSHASVTVDEKVIGAIGQGFLVLLGVSDTDTEEIADKMVDKLCKLRIFQDDQGKTNLSLADVGESLVVSQFYSTQTAAGQTGQASSSAGAPEPANRLYGYVVERCRTYVDKVEHGEFGADMKVELLNDGPFTLVLDSEEICR